MPENKLNWRIPVMGVGLAAVLVLMYSLVLGLRNADFQTHFGIAEFIRRVTWGSSALALNMVMFWCVGVLIHSFQFLDRRLDLRILRWVLGLLLLIIAVAPWLLKPLLIGDGSIAGSASEYVNETVYTHLPAVKWLARFNNTAGLVLVAAFAAAAAGVLKVEVPKSVESDELSAVREYVSTERLLRALLISAGVLVAAALYALHRFFLWAALLRGGEVQEMLEGMASAVTLAGGLLFTVLLGVLFIPVALKLVQWQTRLRLEKLQESPDLDWREWAVRHEINSPLQMMSSYLGLLLPALSGVAAQIVRGL